ncbi:MAG: DUF5011 domain-containing protein, partial [Opitutales bacterium]|nr:DUF5011 domain-containing protein [Opitutales bacterium]
GSNNLTLNSWLHRVGVVEANGNMRLYLNGNLEDSNSNTSALPTLTRTQQYVGKSNWSADGYLDGLIDDFRIYNRALSATEVSNLHQLPASDADGDGYTYVEELEAGTNPNSSLSKPSLMDGLLLWYPLDGNTSDMSGNDRHASLSNANGSTSGFVSGKVLKALDLDGVDDYLSVPHDSGLDLRRTLSLSMWLKLDAIPSTGYSAIMYKGGGNDGSSRTYSLWLENGSRFIHATSADSTDQQYANSANSAFTNNSWMHLVMLLDRYNGSIKVFKDKALVANSTVRSTNTVSSQNPLLFGKSQESNSDFSVINGQMDDIRLYDRVLYSFEIEDLFDAVATDTDSDGLNDAEEMLLDTNLTSSDTDGDGLTDFQEVKGFHTYEQINGSYTWSAAKADAESRGGYLATVTSLEEKNEIELVRTTNSWLGGSDTQTEGTWAWVTGEPWSYHFWNTSEPNGGTGENYLVTYSSDGRWNDLGVGNVPYILEKEYFSNPKLSDSDSDGYLDLNETQLGTDPSSYDSSPSPSNTAPTNLLLSQSQINENQPVGASVGSFSATDADGDNLFYYLVAGAGDAANSYFTLDVNGSLQTAVVFDYENNASIYSIRVQVKDEYNASIEGNFSVTLLDLDDTAPVINLNGDAQVTHEAGSPYLDANASWTDAVDGSGVVYASGVVVAGVPGTYQLTYNYADAAGNVAQEIIRTVEVVDTTAPVINLVGGLVITHPVGSVYSDSGASWNDAVDGAGTISSVGSVNFMNPDTYTLSYDYTDQAGNAAQSIVRTVNVVNSSPNGLAVINDQNLTFFENEPNGTLLGQFVGSDPNSNTQFGYELISVFDANDSSLLLENAFQVASNGTLRSLHSFDYEEDPRKYILSVQVNDQFGGSFSRSFSAYVRNVVEDLDGDGVEDHFDIDDDGDGFEDSVEVAYGHDPDDNQSKPRLALVETITPSFDGNRSYTLSGTILSSGGMPVTSYGIVIIEQNGTESYYEAETIEADFNATFHVLFENLKAGKTYQYSSFVRNFVGESRGQFLRVEVEEKINLFAWWADSRELDGGWRESDWFGTFLRNSENGWVYHLDLAWIFTRSDGTGGMWMWRNEEESWLWAEPSAWPFLWSDLTKDWLYFIFLEEKIKIFDYSQGSFR